MEWPLNVIACGWVRQLIVNYIETFQSKHFVRILAPTSNIRNRATNPILRIWKLKIFRNVTRLCLPKEHLRFRVGDYAFAFVGHRNRHSTIRRRRHHLRNTANFRLFVGAITLRIKNKRNACPSCHRHDEFVFSVWDVLFLGGWGIWWCDVGWDICPTDRVHNGWRVSKKIIFAIRFRNLQRFL